ncbi:hypothetical protein SDJN03_30352, partial [Cucurbita argyrosperma subsp. sororia]
MSSPRLLGTVEDALVELVFGNNFGVVQISAQEIHWYQSQIDVEDVMTVSALSLQIVRQKDLDDKAFHIINIPTRNQDTFLRRGYYGGHVDVYKPYGSNLDYSIHDVNSLYPFIIQSYPMPCGVPEWHTHLKGVGLDSLFGFIEAYVSSTFEGLIYDLLYESRLEAKKRSHQPMTFVYKLLMNSLYGRFGMNPESTVTEIRNLNQYEDLMKMENLKAQARNQILSPSQVGFK